MTRPYFQVGEEAVVQSKNFPEHNGSVITILEVCPPIPSGTKNKYDPYYTRTRNDQFSYWLDLSGSILSDKCSGWMSQSSLRKKHQGGEDFSTLMNTLKSPIMEGAGNE